MPAPHPPLALPVPSYAAQTLGLRQVASLDVMQTRIGASQPRRRRPALSLDLRKLFPGEHLAPGN